MYVLSRLFHQYNLKILELYYLALLSYCLVYVKYVCNLFSFPSLHSIPFMSHMFTQYLRH